MNCSFSLNRFIVFACLLLCLFTRAQGQDFWSNGIHYSMTSETTAEVTYMDYYCDDWDNQGYYNFYESYVGDIVIPSEVTAWVQPEYEEAYEVTVTITGIGSFAFSNCYELTSITLPSTIETIGFYAFHECSALTSITCLGTIPPVAYDEEESEYVFDASTYDAATLFVPAAALADYQVASVWRNFTHIKANGATAMTGDVDGDGMVTIADVTDLIDYLINGGDDSFKATAADVDGDGTVGIGDVTELIDKLLNNN